MGNSFFRFPPGRIFRPVDLVFRQLGGIIYFSHLVGWDGIWGWLRRHTIDSLPIAAGATGMGCIGYPGHPAWEVTSACNLSCVHCHAGENANGRDDLTTPEAKAFIDELRKVEQFRTLVYTGGEPLVRADLFDLLEHSYRAGFINVIATNGTLITDEAARAMKKAGVAAVAVSLDSSQQHIHNSIRGNGEAFNLAMRGIEAVKKAGIALQINMTAMEYNFADIENVIELAEKKQAAIVLMYQLVPVGRGNKIGRAKLDLEQNRQLLQLIAEKQKKVSVIVEPVAGPQYWAYLLEKRGLRGQLWLKLAEQVFHGCAAGRGFVYIKANGDVWPCPFVEINAGNVREKSFDQIWREAEVFQMLRSRETLLKGSCAACDYKKICGGCRGRAAACGGELMAEDPSCFIGKSSIGNT